MPHHAFVLLANAVDPLLAVAAVGLALTSGQQDSVRTPLIRLGYAAAALLVVWPMSKWLKHLQLWHGHPNFPSDHAAFAVCLTVSMGWMDRRALYILVPAVMAYFALIVHLNYHTWAEIAGGTLFAAVGTGLLLAALDRWATQKEPNRPVDSLAAGRAGKP